MMVQEKPLARLVVIGTAHSIAVVAIPDTDRQIGVAEIGLTPQRRGVQVRQIESLVTEPEGQMLNGHRRLLKSAFGDGSGEREKSGTLWA